MDRLARRVRRSWPHRNRVRNRIRDRLSQRTRSAREAQRKGDSGPVAGDARSRFHSHDGCRRDGQSAVRGGESAAGGRFKDEINSSAAVYQRGYKAGTVAMANAGPNTNGSQFFIMHSDYPLPPNYTIFGRVTAGQEVVDSIATSATDRNDRPSADVKMEKVTIEA